MNRLVSMLLVSITTVAICACQTRSAENGAETSVENGVVSVPYRTLISRNLININKLSLGMTRKEVEHIMGSMQASTHDSVVANPYKVEPMRVGESQYEVLYYLTRKYPPFTPIKDSQATPVILKDGRVVGWGWGNLNALKAGKL